LGEILRNSPIGQFGVQISYWSIKIYVSYIKVEKFFHFRKMANNFRVEFIPPDNPSTVRVTPMLPANQMPDELGMFGNIAMILRREARIIAQRQINDVVTNSQRVLRATGKLLNNIRILANDKH
jgi:hypothetical protein